MSAKKLEQAIDKLPEIKKSLPRLNAYFCSVFTENSKRSRLQFFRSELIQLMWNFFLENDRDFLPQYFREMKAKEGDVNKLQVLIKDIQSLSGRIGFQIVPFLPQLSQ